MEASNTHNDSDNYNHNHGNDNNHGTIVIICRIVNVVVTIRNLIVMAS